MDKITNISSFFRHENSKWIFVGKKLEVWIPEIYKERGLLTLGDIARSLGIFQLRFNDKQFANFMFLGYLNLEYDEATTVNENGFSYIVLTLNSGRTFIHESLVIKESKVIYTTFTTMITLGHLPPFLEYDTVHQLFDNDKLLAGIDLGINHSIWEMIYSHLFRDKKDPYKHYRLTPMTTPPEIVSLSQISHGPESTTAKLLGSYMNEGIISSLVDDRQKKASPVENLLRG